MLRVLSLAEKEQLLKLKDNNMKVKVYTTEGKEKESIELPKDIFDLKWNSDLVHQVVTSMESSARPNVAHTKGRGEVRGGGKKPWKQKGTGRARHGSTRSPIWIGGGVTFGPTNQKNYERKVNKKMKTKALFTILSKKLKDDEIIFVDQIKFDAPKTKDAKKFIDNISTVKGFEKFRTKRNNKAVISMDGKDLLAQKSFANFSNVETIDIRNLNPVSLVKYKYLVISNPAKSLEVLANKINK
jgi:large subunit ribosomal protein L4